MKPFIYNNFILINDAVCEHYYNLAKKQPIIDDHCHLNRSMIASNHSFNSIKVVWLGGDQYKWLVMRVNDINKEHITADKSDWEKFEK